MPTRAARSKPCGRPPRSRCWRMTAPSCPRRRLSSSISTDRKSTRLNSSHANISYAVFCLKKQVPEELGAAPHLLSQSFDLGRHLFRLEFDRINRLAHHLDPLRLDAGSRFVSD